MEGWNAALLFANHLPFINFAMRLKMYKII